jgi:hypothetical protein
MAWYAKFDGVDGSSETGNPPSWGLDRMDQRAAAASSEPDRIDDIIIGPGPHGHVKAFDGHSGAELASFFAFDQTFGGGGAGEGDGFDDIIVGTGGGFGHVKAFDGVTGAEIRSFLAYDQGFHGGVAESAGHIKSFSAYDGFHGAENTDLDAIIAAGGHHDGFDHGFIGGIFVPVADVEAGKGNPGVIIYAGFQF